MSNDSGPVRPDETPGTDFDPIAFLGGPFYRVVNATAQYVAAFAATTLAQILSGSIFLVGLKYALLMAFIGRAFHLTFETRPGRTDSLAKLLVKLVAVCLLAGLATMAAFAAVEAGLVQLDGDRAAEAAKVERVRQKWRRVGIGNGCYDPDYSDPRVCAEIARRQQLEVAAVRRAAKVKD